MSMTIEHAIALSANVHNVSEGSILGRKRGARIDAARRVVMLRLHRNGWTPARIGLYMGRHRTTVLHALGLRTRAAQAAEEKP